MSTPDGMSKPILIISTMFPRLDEYVVESRSPSSTSSKRLTA